MKVLVLLTAVALPVAWPVEVSADKGAVDVSAVVDNLSVYEDGNGHYVVLIPVDGDQAYSDSQREAIYNAKKNLFYGNGKTFRRQSRVSMYRQKGEGDSKYFRYYFHHPRIPKRKYNAQGSFHLRGERGEIQCEERKVAFQRLPDDKAKAMIAKAKFIEEKWQHIPYLLARNNRGIYFYVDKHKTNKGFRFWVGRTGAMKRQKLVDVASDSEGNVFVLKKTQLLANVKKSDVTWVVGKEETKLKWVPHFSNTELIYKRLGMYDGVTFGTPCDDF